MFPDIASGYFLMMRSLHFRTQSFPGSRKRRTFLEARGIEPASNAAVDEVFSVCVMPPLLPDP